MNVDREDELRIQAPPGAASASESWLQLDGTGMMPEAQERKQRTTAHTNCFREPKRKNFSAKDREVLGSRERKSLDMKECVRVRVCESRCRQGRR